MNRGRGRQVIFHGKNYFQSFLDTIAEAQQRFNCVIHAYCLMSNHYHLLIQTPDANLSRIMRHINGVYTQRHNRLKKTDGSLFRGRYKAILVERDAYLLQLSRYIHRNPIELKRARVKKLEDYPWSSYPAYINKAKAPEWLERETSYGLLGSKQRYKGYANYIMEGADPDVVRHYNRGNLPSVIGTKDFKERIYEEELGLTVAEKKARTLTPELTIADITRQVAKHYKTKEDYLRAVIKGPQKGNEARKVAMYLSQEIAAAKLQEIADYFNLGHTGSVSFITHQVRVMKETDKRFSSKIDKIVKSIVKQLT